MVGQYFGSVGRRKSSVARVRIYSGQEGFVVNGKPAADYFTREIDMMTVMEPLRVVGAEDSFSVSVHVSGGGISGQAGAIRHGIARALEKSNPEWRGQLKSAGFLSRDPRSKERKKPGLKRARKAPQYTKR